MISYVPIPIINSYKEQTKMLWTTNGRMYELPFKFCLCILNISHTEIVIFLPLVTFVSLSRGNFSDLKNKHSRLPFLFERALLTHSPMNYS